MSRSTVYLERQATDKEFQDLNILRKIAFGFSASAMLREIPFFHSRLKIPKEKEEELSSLKELFAALGLGKIDLTDERTLYRAALLFLRASEAF